MPILRDIYYAVKGKVRRVIKLMIRGFCCVISMRQKSFLSQKTGRKARPVLGIKKGISDFLVIGYPYSENTCNFIYVTSFVVFS